ncbi:hypothetical protein BGW38_006119 [Lunasporangiospora selenospora]|uniref:Uncharacterized protein n=1 Tax=Lunasporangiospora selenospora TaxID=979761 RepID=A0A9P6KJ13_9FUNG|nr:hypothetical protein BGW38_006119 [Lunasporangiospora selenospora]
MGLHNRADATTIIHLPPTLQSSHSSHGTSARFVSSIRGAVSQHPPSSSGSRQDVTKQDVDDGQDVIRLDVIKQEPEKGKDKIVKPRKKRGQYKKTILRDQAEAAAAAAAIGLPPPQYMLVTTNGNNEGVGKISLPMLESAASQMRQDEGGKGRFGESSTSPTVESLGVGQSTEMDEEETKRYTLEMEQELAMLAEEAEEDRKKRDEEAADRILKRAQVVKHLRGLKSKLACAQIQVGQDLHYQSVDLFSEIFDEVLEDIGKDNTEMLKLLKARREQESRECEIDGFDSSFSGHMPTRSSDKPKKRDLLSELTDLSSFTASTNHQRNSTKNHNSRSSPFHTQDDEPESEDISVHQSQGECGSSQFIGQSWDVGPGKDEQVRKTGGGAKYAEGSTESAALLIEDDEEESLESSHPHPVPKTREDLQLRHRQELEELQLRQRKEQEAFQRRQLDQLRELQSKQNQEIRQFETVDMKKLLEHEVPEKRLKLGHLQYGRHSDVSYQTRLHHEVSPSSFSLYGSDAVVSGRQKVQPLSSLRSPSPPPLQRTQSEQHRAPAINLWERPSLSRQQSQAPAGGPKLHKTATNTRGTINPLPMSTMTLALTAMNEKKKLLKRAMKKQSEHVEAGSSSIEHPESRSNQGSTPSQSFSPPRWTLKKVAPDGTLEGKSYSPKGNPATLGLPSLGQFGHYKRGTGIADDPSGESTPSRHVDQAVSASLLHSASTHQGYLKTANTKIKTKKRRNSSQLSEHGADEGAELSGSIVGDRRSLLDHLDAWDGDTDANNIFDLVMSEPPDVGFDEEVIEGLLGEKHSSANNNVPASDQSKQQVLSSTSDSLRWLQESQQASHALGHSSSALSLDKVTGIGGYGSAGSLTKAHAQSSHNHQAESTNDEVLFLNEDSLAELLRPKKRSHHDVHINSSFDSGSNSSSNSSSNSNTYTQVHLADSTPLNLYGADGGEEWGFTGFSVDQFLDHDAF